MNDYSTGGAAWFAIALINAGLAEQKYRSRIAWFLISVFVGLNRTGFDAASFFVKDGDHAQAIPPGSA